MFLYKASGATYKRVVDLGMHAFSDIPVKASDDEFILLSKNRPLLRGEKQVQYVAKLHSVREAADAELDDAFPGVDASIRWRYVIRLYWMKKLHRAFDLSEVRGFNARRYLRVRSFAKLDDDDERLLLSYLISTNEQIVLDFVNHARRPDESDG